MKNWAGRIQWVQYLGLIANGFVFNLMGPLLPVLKEELHMNYSQSGLVLSALFFGEIVTVLTGGLLVDRLGKKPFIMVGSVLFSGGLLCSALVNDYITLFIWSLVTGIGFGTYEVGMNALCGDTSGDNKGFAMNFMHMFFGFGAILAPVLAAGCLAFASWRWAFVLVAIPPVAVAFLLRPIKLARRTKAAEEADRSTPFFRTWFIWLAGAGIFIYMGIEVVMACWTPSYWKVLGAGWLTPSLTVTAFWLAVTVGRLISSILADRIGLSRFIIGMGAGSILVAASWCLFPGPVGTLAAIILTGLLLAGMYPTIMATAIVRYPTKTGAVASMISLSAGASSFLVAAGLGMSIDAFSLKIIPWAGLFFAVLLMACALLGWGRKTGRQIGREASPGI